MAAYTRSIKEGTVREVLEAFWIDTYLVMEKDWIKATDLKNQGGPGSGVFVSMFFLCCPYFCNQNGDELRLDPEGMGIFHPQVT